MNKTGHKTGISTSSTLSIAWANFNSVSRDHPQNDGHNGVT